MLVSLCWWQIVRLNSLHTVYRVAMSRGPILKVSKWHLAVKIGPWTTKQSQLVVSVKGESSPGRVVCNSGNSTHLSSDIVIVVAAFFSFVLKEQLSKQMLFLASTPAKVSDNWSLVINEQISAETSDILGWNNLCCDCRLNWTINLSHQYNWKELSFIEILVEIGLLYF